jgi:hypothetical protein
MKSLPFKVFETGLNTIRRGHIVPKRNFDAIKNLYCSERALDTIRKYRALIWEALTSWAPSQLFERNVDLKGKRAGLVQTEFRIALWN